MQYLLNLLIKTGAETVYLTGVIIIAGLILEFLRNNSIRNFQRSFGMNAVMITGFIGVPVHELSHAAVALLFRHKITELKLLQRPDRNGVLGYVNHSYNPRSIYQQIGNFFIGIAPMFGGTISIIALMKIVLPEIYDKFIDILIKNLSAGFFSIKTVEGMLISYKGLLKSIFTLRNLENPYFYLFLFVAVSIASHISLSIDDIRGASRGLAVIFIVLFVFNALGWSKYILAIYIIRYNVLITGFFLITVILSLFTYLLSVLISAVKH